MPGRGEDGKICGAPATKISRLFNLMNWPTLTLHIQSDTMGRTETLEDARRDVWNSPGPGIPGFDARKGRHYALWQNPLVVCAVWRAQVSSTNFADCGPKTAKSPQMGANRLVTVIRSLCNLNKLEQDFPNGENREVVFDCREPIGR